MAAISTEVVISHACALAQASRIRWEKAWKSHRSYIFCWFKTQRNHGEVLIWSGKSWSKDHSHVAHVAKKRGLLCVLTFGTNGTIPFRGENLSVEEAMNYVGGYCVVLDLTGGNLGAWGRCNVEQRGTTWNNVEQRGTTWDDWGRQFRKVLGEREITGSTLAGELCKLLNGSERFFSAKKTSKK